MSKKNHNKLFIPLFLLIILSSGGLAVLSFAYAQTNQTNATSSINVLSESPFEINSYDQIYDESLICRPNFFLIYNEIVHELDVNANGYVCIRFSPIGADETNFTYISVVDEVKIERSESTDMIQIGEGRFESKLGLTTWVLDNQEDWVERLVNDNVNGTQFESGIFSYYYDKDACGMSVFDVGRISDEYSIPKIKFNGWLVKQALNGTDTWTDLPVNSEQCDVTVIDDENHTMITAVRNDTNGILTETYDIPKPINQMKTTLTYINNDVAKNGTHKFAFTNVLNDVPDHMTILLKNQTSFNATSGTVDYLYQHYSSSPNAVPIDYDVNNLTYINGTIDIPRSDFYIYDDITTFNETGSLTLGFEMHYFSEDKQKDDRFSYYFIKDSIDKIWNVKLHNNPVSGKNDIYIDYMNNATAVNLGESVTLDPSIVSALTVQDIKLVTMEGNNAGTEGCSFQPTFNFVTSITGFGWRYDHFGAGSPNNRNTDCTSSLLTYDISSIPDLASVEQIEIKYNVTTMSFPFQWTNRWAMGISEPISVGLTGADVARTVFNCVNAGAFCAGGDTVADNIDFVFNQAAYSPLCGVTTFTPIPCPISTTFIDPNDVTDFFETTIEGGTDFMLLITCSLNDAFNEGSGGGCARRALSDTDFSRIWFGDPASMEFNIQWQVLTPPSEPLNVSATYSASPDKCFVDWDIPLDLGGGLLEGFQIERDSGAGFAVIVADTGSALPTSFTDLTIVPAISFTYRISAINDQGLGVPSEVSNTCGVPELPSAPLGLVASNVALNVVALDWNIPFSDGNSPITGYNVTRINGTDLTVTILDGDTGNTLREFLDNTVTVDTEFGYQVAAINIIGESPKSNTAIILTVGLPDPPDNVSATPTGTSTIQLQWTAPDVGSSTIEGYQIDRKQGVGGIFSTIQPFTGNDDTTFNDGLLAAGTEFCYRLKTLTNIGTSTTFSDEDCATTQDQADPPANMTATAIDGSSINVSWDTPPDDGGSTITGYKIERQKQSDPFEILFTERQPESNRILNDTNREVGTLYTYRVSGITGFGQGETATASDTTDATPQAPQNFVCSPSSTTSILLSWTTPLTFSAPTGYQIDRSPFGGAFSTLVADTSSTETSFLDDGGLPLATKFSYRILAHTAEGDTDFTSTVTCSTLTAPDFPPENVRGDFSEIVPHQTVLAWDIPETFGIPITQFRIERDDGAGFTEIGSVTGSSFAFIDQDLDNDVAQSYQIITVGTQGETVPSIAVPFDANQTSHWHYENTPDDTGFNKNTGTIFGTPNFNGTGHIGKGFLFNGLTRIEVDSSQESDYDFENDQAFGITSYYSGVVGSSPSPFDDEWQLREQQQISTPDTVSASFTITPPLEIDMTPANTRGLAHVFKVFNKADIINKNLSVTWAGTFSGAGIDNRINVLDGSYDRTNSTDFPPNNGLGFTNPLKGAGLLHQVTKFVAFSSTDVINLTLAGSTESQITISMSNRIGATGTTTFMDLTKVEIVGVDSWEWDSSASVTMAVTGTNGDFGVTNANFTNNIGTGVDEVIVSKAQTLTDIGYKFFIDQSNGNPSVKLTNTDITDEIFVQAATNVTDNTLHFIGFGYNGNQTASGITMNVDGIPITPTIITDTLTGTILNNEPLTIGGTSTGTNQIFTGTLDETRIFGSGSLDDEQLDEIAEDELNTTAPINATMTITGSTFANISGELVTIQLISGFPIPAVGTISLDNFTATEVNSVVAVGTIDPITGQFVFDRFFNPMGSLSNYTADTTLTNTLEAFPLLSNFDIQTPVFTFLGDFFFQQARNPTFDILSFNFTSTQQPFDLSCNLKSELFSNGTTFVFTDVFFIQTLFDVPPQTDVVVACIDPSLPVIDPTAPSFGGSNALLSFVSFGGNTGIGNFLQFTANYGDFFGAGLPFLFIIILAAAFTGRSAPTGIIIIGVCLGAMWFLGIIEQDPVMWGIIIVLIVLGALGGKKFL